MQTVREGARVGVFARFVRRRWPLLLCGLLVVLAATGCSAQAGDGTGGPGVQVQVNGGDGSPNDTAAAVQLLILLTALAVAPALLIMVTSFTRVVVVLSLVRNAIGIPQLPPNQVLIGLAVFVSVFIMAPVFKTVNAQALDPYISGQLSGDEALQKAETPIREWMLKQTREQDLALFVKMSGAEQPATVDDVPTYVVIPAFIISELKTAFTMGFIIFVPFLVIDIIVSSALLAMGMMMLPPVVISLPFKILLFVLVDGWSLIIGSLVQSFAQGG
jgi:flagellar biosynthetic protein FliP